MTSQKVENIILDNNYTIIEKIGKGSFGNVYLIKENNSDNIYAAKILNKESSDFNRETKFLRQLQDNNSHNIIKIISYSTGKIVKNNRSTNNKQYLILEFAEKGSLFNYIYFTGKGFGEKYGKYIFYKILKGIKACHSLNICHRDIKLENILLDKMFNPKIADFGSANIFADNDNKIIPLRTQNGTPNYMAPEVIKCKPYNGSLADIFSLGSLLMIIVTGKVGFGSAQKNDHYYQHIYHKNFDRYWNEVEKEVNGLSKEFKNLFIKMVSFTPENRPNIDDILNKDGWLKEMREIKKEELENLEEEIYKEFLNRQIIVEKKLKSRNIKKQNIEKEFCFSENVENEENSEKIFSQINIEKL